MLDVLVIDSALGVVLDDWLAVRASHPALRPVEVCVQRNPFRRERSIFSAPHSAEVRGEGRGIGYFLWDGGRLLCPLEFSENVKRLRQVADELAIGVRATVEVVDDDELVLRTLSFDQPVEVIPFSDAPDSGDSA